MQRQNLKSTFYGTQYRGTWVTLFQVKRGTVNFANPPPSAPILLATLRLRLPQQQKPATGYDPIRYSPKITTPTDQRSYLGISCRTACIQNTNLDSQPPVYCRTLNTRQIVYIHHPQIITNNEEGNFEI